MLIWVGVVTSLTLLVWFNWEFFTKSEGLKHLIKNVIPIVGIATGLLILGMSNFITFPNIRVNNDGIQLNTLIYKSQWVNWDDIKQIKEISLSRKTYRVFGVTLKTNHISPLYLIVGYTQMIHARAFLISDRIKGFERLFEIMREKRPDLFDVE